MDSSGNRSEAAEPHETPPNEFSVRLSFDGVRDDRGVHVHITASAYADSRVVGLYSCHAAPFEDLG